MRGKWFVLVASVVLVALIAAGAMILIRARALKNQAVQPVAVKPVAPVGDINLIGKIRPQQVVGVMAPVEGILGCSPGSPTADSKPTSNPLKEISKTHSGA
jgi:hypothetical protein